MKVVALEKTTMTVAELVELAKEGLVVLTRAGHPVVAVKDLSGSDWESVSLASNPKFMALIEESRRSYRDSGGISLEDLRHELDLGTATGHAARKAARSQPEPVIATPIHQLSASPIRSTTVSRNVWSWKLLLVR